jgi:hypothetical protein
MFIRKEWGKCVEPREKETNLRIAFIKEPLSVSIFYELYINTSPERSMKRSSYSRGN